MVHHYFASKKNGDYNFIDKSILSWMEMGGACLHIYKYLGPKETTSTDLTLSNTLNESSIGDTVLMTNATRRYSTDFYEIFGLTTLSDVKFDLSQFGFSLSTTDTLYFTFHINDSVKRIGRKLMCGDIIECTFMRDADILDEDKAAINRFYVIQDVDRDAAGYSATWKPHLLKCRATVLTDSPEFSDILGSVDDPNSLKSNLSTYKQEMSIMDTLLAQADIEVPYNGFSEHQFWVDPSVETNALDKCECTSADTGVDGIPINMNPNDVERGTYFPPSPTDNMYYLRTDYPEPRLFKYYKNRWRLIEVNTKKAWTPGPQPIVDLINNTTTFTDEEKNLVKSRQALSQVVKPRDELY